MPLNKLDNFIKNVEGRILYVNPDDLDSTDSIINEGNSLARPFKTIQRALLEAARFSYVKGANNDIIEKTTILVFPGEHLIDNRPGFAIYDNNNSAFAVTRAGGVGELASNLLSLDLDTNFDLTQEDNILYKFNSYFGGIIIPRGVSIVGLDLRKTKIRPKYVPNPTDPGVDKSAIFRLTGTCYFWQFSFFDGDESSFVYTDPDNFGDINRATPTFSHHKLTCFEYVDGVNNVGTFGLTDLDMYYNKVANAFNSYRDIGQKFPSNPEGFAKRNPEWEIVGAFAADVVNITNIQAGNGITATAIVTVTTQDPHGLNEGTPIKIRGVSGSGVTAPYNISVKVQNTPTPTTFTYVIPGFDANPTLNPAPSAANATLTVETDTVEGASPYIFNVSMRSVWGMNGLHADGRKASGFRSIVVAQFTGISLQKDDRAFAKYVPSSRTYVDVPLGLNPAKGSDLASGSSQTDADKVYHLDSGAVYRSGWETTHVKMSNDAVMQIVSVFAIGFNKHFEAVTGGDASITNSNSNFGQLSLISEGFKKTAFAKDNRAYVTSIVPPRAITGTDDKIEWLSLDVGVTTSVGISSHLYIKGFTTNDGKPSGITQGYRIGARLNDRLYFQGGAGAGTTFSAPILMVDNVIGVGTGALGTTSSVKEFTVTGEPSNNDFTIGPNTILTGESIRIISDVGDLPENITAHTTYYAINNGDNNTIKIASSFRNAIEGEAINVFKGTDLRILSRVSDKDSGDLGSPIQFDSANDNWFIHTSETNDIYSAFEADGVAVYGESTDLSYVLRTADERSLDEKLFKVRAVIPKETADAKDPESRFIIQESSSTSQLTDADFTRTSIDSSDTDYNRNPRFIATCTEDNKTVTVISDLPHNLNVDDTVIIRNVTSTQNTGGTFDLGFNGTFTVTGVNDANTFTYSSTDTVGVAHTMGVFTNDVTVRDVDLPRFERNDMQSNLLIYRNEVISPYIQNQQDGVYHLYVLNANNAMEVGFTDLEFKQKSEDLYPQLDRDNIDSNPRAAKTYAKRSPIGDVETNDQKKSVTRESIDLGLTTLGLGLDITTVETTVGVATITTSREHGLASIVTGTITPGATYNNGTYQNVKLLVGSQTGTWQGATARVVVSGGAVDSVEIISPGSGHGASSLFFDETVIGAGDGNARYVVTAAGISSALGSVVQITGDGTVDDGYYRITAIPSSTKVALARTTGDDTILTSQYALLIAPSSEITTENYNEITGISTFITSTPHGLLSGNSFQVNDSNNNNLGSYLVNSKVSATEFNAITNRDLSSANGRILKQGLSANDAVSDVSEENLGNRMMTFFDDESFTLSADVTEDATAITFTSSGIGTGLRMPLGSYLQIDSEIVRVASNNNDASATVIRGVLATEQESHTANSRITKVKMIPVEFRRPSILRASGHTFEYLGYGPGNYSTGLPQVQVRSLSEREELLSQAQERSSGVVVYTGMNNRGDFYVGNSKKSAQTGEETTFDTPINTVTGEDPSSNSVVFDEVTIKERLLVEGGDSGQVLSQFDGPVTFTKNVRVKNNVTVDDTLTVINKFRMPVGSDGADIKNIQIGVSSVGEIDTSEGDLILDAATNKVIIDADLNVSGDSFFEGDVKVGGNLEVVGVTTFKDDVRIENDLYVDGDVIVPPGKTITGDLVGTATTSEKVHVTATESNSAHFITFVDAATTETTNGRDIRVSPHFYLEPTTSAATADFFVRGDFTAFAAAASDDRLKTNKETITNALEKVLSLSGFTYNWNGLAVDLGFVAEEQQVGISAQQVQAVLPEAVKERSLDDETILTVKYEKLVPLLIEAIKELNLKVEKLEDKLKA